MTLLATSVFTWAMMEPPNTSFDWSICHDWYVDGAGNKIDIPSAPHWASTSVTPSDPYAASGGKSTASPSVGLDFSRAIPIHEELEMPDGKSREFVGKSPEEIKATWYAELHRLSVRGWLLSPVVAILVTLAVSYLMQSLYRALLYVVYGSFQKGDGAAHDDEGQKQESEA
jgi:hypothetical protein